jgi:uncharacterized protein
MVNVESFIQSIGDKPLPPVENWDPNYCGELDLIIKANGTWLYNGTPLTRHKMKHLFSRIIKKENDNYFLVTPVEKVSIQVEWQPFMIIDYDKITEDDKLIYQFVDNFDNRVSLTDLSQLQLDTLSLNDQQAQILPTIRIRHNLFAGFSRSCYYRLMDEAQISLQGDQHQAQITSNGLTFCLGCY